MRARRQFQTRHDGNGKPRKQRNGSFIVERKASTATRPVRRKLTP